MDVVAWLATPNTPGMPPRAVLSKTAARAHAGLVGAVHALVRADASTQTPAAWLVTYGRAYHYVTTDHGAAADQARRLRGVLEPLAMVDRAPG